jgi:hypothetical protein
MALIWTIDRERKASPALTKFLSTIFSKTQSYKRIFLKKTSLVLNETSLVLNETSLALNETSLVLNCFYSYQIRMSKKDFKILDFASLNS